MLLSRFWRLSGAGVVLPALALDWCFGMVIDGFHTQRRGSCIPGKERAERNLAGTIAIMEGRHGFVKVVLNPMFGRGGVAGDATTTTRLDCGECTSRQLRRKLAIGPRAAHR